MKKEGFVRLTLEDIRPVSTNHKSGMNRKTGRVFKSKGYAQMESEATAQLLKYRDMLKEFESHYREGCGLGAIYKFSVPNLYTKKGSINKKSLDVDNCVKPINDVVFKFFSRIDDSFILDERLLKVQSEGGYRIEIELFIL